MERRMLDFLYYFVSIKCLTIWNALAKSTCIFLANAKNPDHVLHRIE